MIKLSRRTVKTIELLNNFIRQINDEVIPYIKPAHDQLLDEFVQVLIQVIDLYSSGNGKSAQDKLNLARHFANDSLPIFEYQKFVILYNKFEDDLMVLRWSNKLFESRALRRGAQLVDLSLAAPGWDCGGKSRTAFCPRANRSGRDPGSQDRRPLRGARLTAALRQKIRNDI